MWFHVDTAIFHVIAKPLGSYVPCMSTTMKPIPDGWKRRPAWRDSLGLVAIHHSPAKLVGVDTCNTCVSASFWGMHMITLTVTAKITMKYSMRIDPCREFSKMAIIRNTLWDKPKSLFLAMAVQTLPHTPLGARRPNPKKPWAVIHSVVVRHFLSIGGRVRRMSVRRNCP